MAFVPGTNVVEAQLIYTFLGQRMENTLYFQKGSAWVVPDMQALGAYLETTFWNNLVRPQVSNVCSLVEIDLRDLTTVSGFNIVWTGGMPRTGAQTGDPIPGSNTVAISFKTLNAGRSYRGRNYFVGLNEGQVSGNQITVTVRDALRTAWSILLATSATPPPATWGVFSRFTAGAPRVTGVFTPITNVTVDVDVDSQRRRLAGRGR